MAASTTLTSSLTSSLLPTIPETKCQHNTMYTGYTSMCRCWVCRGRKITTTFEDCDHESEEIQKRYRQKDGTIKEIGWCWDCNNSLVRIVTEWKLKPQKAKEIEDEKLYYFEKQQKYDLLWLIRHIQGVNAANRHEKMIETLEDKEANVIKATQKKRKAEKELQKEQEKFNNSKKSKLDPSVSNLINTTNNQNDNENNIFKLESVQIIDDDNKTKYIIHSERVIQNKEINSSNNNYTACGNSNCQDFCRDCEYASLKTALQIAKDQGHLRVFGMPISLIEVVKLISE